MIYPRLCLTLAIAFTLSGCGREHVSGTSLSPSLVTGKDVLHAPHPLRSDRLAWAADGTQFPPVMTEPSYFPTQEQAQKALVRAYGDDMAAGIRIRLFACKPGALDDLTGRVERVRPVAAVCAAELVTTDGRILGRGPVNFSYSKRDQVWRLKLPDPVRTPVPWIDHKSAAATWPTSRRSVHAESFSSGQPN